MNKTIAHRIADDDVETVVAGVLRVEAEWKEVVELRWLANASSEVLDLKEKEENVGEEKGLNVLFN